MLLEELQVRWEDGSAAKLGRRLVAMLVIECYRRVPIHSKAEALKAGMHPRHKVRKHLPRQQMHPLRQQMVQRKQSILLRLRFQMEQPHKLPMHRLVFRIHLLQQLIPPILV